jgi:hypothetical protein
MQIYGQPDCRRGQAAVWAQGQIGIPGVGFLPMGRLQEIL